MEATIFLKNEVGEGPAGVDADADKRSASFVLCTLSFEPRNDLRRRTDRRTSYCKVQSTKFKALGELIDRHPTTTLI